MIVDANFDPSGLPSSGSRNQGNADSTDAVWHCSINDSLLQQPSIVESIACHLPEYERSYIMKYHFEADRKRSLISSLLQRALIQKTFSIAMGEYTIKRTKEVRHPRKNFVTLLTGCFEVEQALSVNGPTKSYRLLELQCLTSRRLRGHCLQSTSSRRTGYCRYWNTQ